MNIEQYAEAGDRRLRLDYFGYMSEAKRFHSSQMLRAVLGVVDDGEVAPSRAVVDWVRVATPQITAATPEWQLRI